MRIHLPAGAWIGNIDQFIRSFDTSDEKVLEITSHEKWVSVHPVVLCMITALGLFMRKHKSKINFQKMEAKSKHYFERMGLFRALDLNSEMTIISHELWKVASILQDGGNSAHYWQGILCNEIQPPTLWRAIRRFWNG